MTETTYTLTCCSTADLSKEHFAKIDVPYVCFHFIIDGEVYPDDLGETMSFEEFYQRESDGAMPTTSQVSVGQFLEFFGTFLDQGQDILHVSLSGAISGAYESACIAAEQLRESYPDRTIYIVDSLSASSGYGLLMDTAAAMRTSGASLESVQEWLEASKLNMHLWFVATDLSHLQRGGRISAGAAAIGNLLNVCPVLTLNGEGAIEPQAKARGKKKALATLVKRMEEHADGSESYSGKAYISHSAAYDDARYVADLVEKQFPNLSEPVLINNIGTVIGTHTGPGTIALFFYGEPRS